MDSLSFGVLWNPSWMLNQLRPVRMHLPLPAAVLGSNLFATCTQRLSYRLGRPLTIDSTLSAPRGLGMPSRPWPPHSPTLTNTSSANTAAATRIGTSFPQSPITLHIPDILYRHDLRFSHASQPFPLTPPIIFFRFIRISENVSKKSKRQMCEPKVVPVQYSGVGTLQHKGVLALGERGRGIVYFLAYVRFMGPCYMMDDR